MLSNFGFCCLLLENDCLDGLAFLAGNGGREILINSGVCLSFLLFICMLGS